MSCAGCWKTAGDAGRLRGTACAHNEDCAAVVRQDEHGAACHDDDGDDDGIGSSTQRDVPDRWRRAKAGQEEHGRIVSAEEDASSAAQSASAAAAAAAAAVARIQQGEWAAADELDDNMDASCH